ncbi:hypothetical protein ACF1AY_38950 [Streptomyces sp. NPDC014776]|uniref:hypothetical protein n=1 Tax=unclassified Streptomyces TaxID=2593676 RepID=UPI0036F9DC70
MTASFPKIRTATLEQIPAWTASWWYGKKAGSRASGFNSASPATGTGAGGAARHWPAHYVVFDLVHAGADLTGRLYERRRATL